MAMDLKLKEITLIRLLSLLLWTLLVIFKQNISSLIEVIECHVFEKTEQALSVLAGRKIVKGVTLLPPLSDELVFSQIWPHFHWRVNISLLWRASMRESCLERRWRYNTSMGNFGHGSGRHSKFRLVSCGAL